MLELAASKGRSPIPLPLTTRLVPEEHEEELLFQMGKVSGGMNNGAGLMAEEGAVGVVRGGRCGRL